MEKIREEVIEETTESTTGEHSTSSLQTKDVEKAVTPQSITLSQNIVAKKMAIVNQEIEHIFNSESVFNVNKFERSYHKHKVLHGNVDTEYSRSGDELMSCQSKQEVQQTSSLKQVLNVQESFPSLLNSKTCSAVSCLSDNHLVSKESDATAFSGETGGLCIASSSNVSTDVCEKDIFNFSLEESALKLDQTFEQPAKKKKMSCLKSLSAVKEITLHQSEDEYDHVTTGLVYAVTSFPGSGIDQKDYMNGLIEGCRCIGVCSESCACTQVNGFPYEDGKLRLDYESRPIFECNDDCSCSENCPNRLTQHGPLTGLKINLIPEKGYGVITSHFIPKHAFVCEYAGEFISVEEAQRRFSKQGDKESNYILILREHAVSSTSRPWITIIDPTVVGNIGRYINHSCDPNLVVVPVRVHNMVPIAALFAKKDIVSGEELCYDYNTENKFVVTHSLVDNSSMNVREADCSLSVEIATGERVVLPSCSRSVKGTSQLQLDRTSHKTVSKLCLCKAKNCRRFLPVNDTLF